MATFLQSFLILVLTLVAGAVGGVVVSVPQYWGTNREMDVKMVEIAVGILSQEPKKNIAPARDWAVDVISFYAKDVALSQEVREALVNNQVVGVAARPRLYWDPDQRKFVEYAPPVQYDYVPNSP